MTDLADNEVVKAILLGFKIDGVRVPHSKYAPPPSEEPDLIMVKWKEILPMWMI